MNRSVHELVEFSVVGDETHADSVWLRHEECRADAFGRFLSMRS